MDYTNIKLYEIASMLSPSIYETIFHSQYQGRSDKDAIILDNETFNKFYISDNIYKNFLFSNAIKLGKSIDYIGLNQMHSSIIKEFKINNNQIKMKLYDFSLTNLAKTLVKIKSLNIDIVPFYIYVIFNGVNYYSNNYLDKYEKLIPICDNFIGAKYIQDQFIFINDQIIDIVFSAQLNNIKKLMYILVSCNNIDIIDESKCVWKNIFKNDFSTLYEYFFNIKKVNNLIQEEHYLKSIIEGYEKFMSDFIDLE